MAAILVDQNHWLNDQQKHMLGATERADRFEAIKVN
jgi:hypothetical protein